MGGAETLFFKSGFQSRVRGGMKSIFVSTGAIVLFCILAQEVLFADDLNTGGQLGVVRTLSTATLGKYGITAGSGFKYAADGEYAGGPNGTGSVLRVQGLSLVPVNKPDPAELWSGNLFVAYGLNNFLDVSVNLPVYRDVTGWGAASSGAGDFEIAAKLRYPDVKLGAFFSAAYYCKVIVPTGGGFRGFFPRNSYYIVNDLRNTVSSAVYTDDVVYVNPMFVWTFDLSSRRIPGRFHANIGVVHGAGTQATALAAALAVEVQAAPSLLLFTELFGEARVKYFVDSYTWNPFAKDPVRFSPGFRLRLPKGFHCAAAVDIGITDNPPAYRANWEHDGFRYSTRAVPGWGGQIILGWAGRTRIPDRDRDGISDDFDKCLNQPEDLDGFEDTDGCPDIDNDRDGVPDSLDKCLNQPEDRDGFEDADGCPDIDNDRDGVPDSLDKCLNQPEDRDGFEDADGCLDYDNDKDGIADSLDKCPNLPEDMDGFEDADGCPEYDNDHDGVADSLDKCPLAAGPAETGGCPAADQPKAAGKRGPLILNGVMFANGNAVLTQASCAILDQVARSLLEWIEVKVEIQGHSDDMEQNQKLSQLRADVVRDYLSQRGIASERMQTADYGSSVPLAVSASATDRQKNRRVEFRRIN